MSVETLSSLRKSSEIFLDFLDQWYSGLPMVSMKSLLKDFSADHTAMIAVDMVNGFCVKGNLASPRVGALIQPVVELFQNAEQNGINHYLLPQDCHPADSQEFKVYPPHCMEGSEEAKTVHEIAELPQAYKYRLFPKKTINPGLDPHFQDWLQQHEEVRQFIIVGDCTDICIHQLALFLKLQSIQKQTLTNVVIPANCVDTFDISMEDSRRLQAQPHPADLMHVLFLYHMHLNGIRIVAGIE
jgi:nicotinamidase-related amidase